MVRRRLGYLSGAPRVSTLPEARAAGPRAHVLGVMRAFELLGWEVKPFIAGNHVPRKWIREGTEHAANAGAFRKLAADILRLLMGLINMVRAWREMDGQVDWVYERSSVFQALGWIFKQRGIFWILEINAPFFYEAAVERNSIVLGRIARYLEVRAYRKCDALVCVSNALKDLVVEETGIQPEKVVVVPNGVDTTFYDPDRHESERFFEGFTVGFIGSLLAWQALDLLLEVLKELRAEGMDTSLVIVGDGIMREAWEEETRRLGLSDHVVFTGWVHPIQVPQIISGFDLGYSGQIRMQVGSMYHSPIKIYEYMSMSKPVIASDFEDAQMVIRDGGTGFLFEGGNKADLKSALTVAYCNQDKLSEMGRRAREEIVARHSWTARVSTMIPALERLQASS